MRQIQVEPVEARASALWGNGKRGGQNGRHARRL
jgi:hypothetical protein